MKNLVLLFVTIFSASILLAQHSIPNEYTKQEQRSRNGQNLQTRNQTAIWSCDFSSSVGWTTTSENNSNRKWVIYSPGQPAVYPIPTINSTTAFNGYAVFNATINLWSSYTTSLTTTVPINLSGHPHVILEFQQQFMKSLDTTSVLISTNGVTWNRYVVNEDLVNNQPLLTNPEIIQLDISSVAGNASTVYLRFQYSDPTALPSYGKAWMIDDIRIFDKPKNDLQLANLAWLKSANNPKQPIVFTPTYCKNQLTAHYLFARIKNKGVYSQKNCKLIAEIQKSRFSLNTSITPIGTLPPNSDTLIQIQTPAIQGYFPQSDTYRTRVYVISDSTDENQTDDTLSRTWVVDDRCTAGTYVDPFIVRPTLTSSIGTNSFPGYQDAIGIGRFFTVTKTDSAHWIGVRLAPGTRTGGDIYLSILDTVGLFTPLSNNFLPEIINGDMHTITDVDSAIGMAWHKIPDIYAGVVQNKILNGNGYTHT